MTSNLTFVSAFINIYGDKPFNSKDFTWRFDRFRIIAETGIQLCIYVSPDCLDLLTTFSQEYPNIKIMKVMTIQDTWIYKTTTEYPDIVLPDSRNMEKDTFPYMCLMHSKIELMADTIQLNPWNTTHFAWIDFSISYIFKNISDIQEKLRTLSRRVLASEFITFPGCWDRIPEEGAENHILHQIHWRFCGGFFLGDRNTILDFHAKYLEHFPKFLDKFRKMVWEVNFWAYLEAVTDWRPKWYCGDHNDTILNISADVCSMNLSLFYEEQLYDYPKIETYEPCSAAYLYYQGKHILNTRFINYICLPSGHYQVNHPENTIISKNIVSILNDNLQPVSYDEMQDPADLPQNSGRFLGLEDIRLYLGNDQDILFIATSISYSSKEGNRMVIGKYDIANKICRDCRVIEPPQDTWCEKNWTPVSNTTDSELFIYKWSPMEIGKIVDNKLEIVNTYSINAPFFNRVRGSTIFSEYDDNTLVGLVHFSEDYCPRHYYHILVMLEKETFRPLKYTQIFHFEKLSIEFCIGLRIDQFLGVYQFWISRFDRDPALVSIAIDKVPFCFDFAK